jgi:DNA repair protein RecO (recombination protein O)
VNQTVVTGMVLSATPIGEYDRRVVLLTKERGRISAFAKGARRPNSSLVAAVNPFAFGEFTIFEGRTSNTIQSAHISNYFSKLREDVEGAYYGFYFLELAGYYTREGQDEREMLKLLYQTMRALTHDKIPNRLIRYIYELKTICINGEGPQMFQCVVCGCKDNLSVFSARKGGMVCSDCLQDIVDGMHLDTSTVYTTQYIESSRIENLYTFLVSDRVLVQLGRVMKRYMEVYVERQFKSLGILETILEN